MSEVWSDKFKEMLLNNIVNGMKLVGLNGVLRRKELQELVREDFDTYNATIHSRIMAYIDKSPSNVDFNYLPRLSTMIEEYWTYNHNLHFLINIDDFSEVPDVDFTMLTDGTLPEDLDIIVDFEYRGEKFCCSLLHTTYGIKEDSGVEHIGFGLHMARKNKDYGYSASSVLLYPTYSTKKVYNNACNTFCEECRSKCAVCKGVSVKLNQAVYDNLVGVLPPSDVYIVPRARQCNGTCASSQTGFNDLTFNDISKYIMFAINQYFSRKVQRVETIKRDRVPQVKMEMQEEVPVDVLNKELATNYESHRFITIRDAIRYERKHGSKHSHHSSPCTHYRRGTVRHYKNGKVVQVKGSVVNADKNKDIIYKVKE